MKSQSFRARLGFAFAGIRIATITTIGLVTVTALIGEGGLGGPPSPISALAY